MNYDKKLKELINIKTRKEQKEAMEEDKEYFFSSYLEE